MNTINEKKMTSAQKTKREKIVKGMKRAKEVMYATATKEAMKENIKFDDFVNKLLSENYEFKK